MSSPLGKLTRAELEFLRKAIASHKLSTPLTEVALQAIGKGALFARLGPLAGANEEVALALLDLALAAGGAAAAPARKTAAAGLVWTGPDVPHSPARSTTAVVLELLAQAQERVLVVGYELDFGAVLFGPLHKVMVERAVKVSIFLDVPPAPSPKTNMDAYLAVKTHQFLEQNWPFGEPLPQLYHYPAGTEHGSHRSLHAKCIVVDARHVLVGSANFTKRGHQRNLEIGVLLEDPTLAAVLTKQLELLVAAGKLVALPALSSHPAPPASAEDEVDPAALAAELLVSDAARPLFVRALASGLPVPDVGEDLEGALGEVVGSAELSWGALHVAVLLPEQEGARKKLEAAGWSCFPVNVDDDGFNALCERVRREA